MTIAAAKPADTSTKDMAKYSEMLRSGSFAPHGYVVLLGLDTVELPALLREIRRGLPFRSYERFARSVAMPNERLLKLLDIPRRTLLRRKATGRFSPGESDRLLRAARVIASALALFDGDRDAAIEWLGNPQLAFGGAIPLDMAQTEIGAREVETLAYRLEHGVYS
jgi:putative toxin-antitoxin system antitoxin component (TIGR02293 family)